MSAHPECKRAEGTVVGSDEEQERNAQAWKRFDTFVHKWKGKLPVLPPEATSTEALYE